MGHNLYKKVMAQFALKFVATQSEDGSQVLITDQSNWGAGNNDQNYSESQFTRTLVLTDALGNAITSIVLPTNVNTATYNVPANTNPWINIDYVLSNGPVSPNLLQSYPFQRYFELAYIAEIKGNCGCGCIGDNPMCQVDAVYQGADFAAPVGDAVNYQNDIDSAYKILTNR